MNEDETLSGFDAHEAQACGGIASACTYCDAEDLLAKKCRVCDKPTGGPRYCLRCEYKVEQLHNERLYDAVVGRE